MNGLQWWERLSRLVPAPTLPDEDGWRRSLLVALPFAILAFVLGALLESRATQPYLLDTVAYPLLALGLGLLELTLFLRPGSTGRVVLGIILTCSVYFLTKFVSMLFFTPPGLSVPAEMTETYFWVPALYVLSFFVPNVRGGRAVSYFFFGVTLLLSAAYVALHQNAEMDYRVVFALTEYNLANLTLLALAGAFLGFKERVVRAEARAETLQRLAYTDLLTELPNRLHFNLTLQAALETARQAKQPLALLFVDVDGFKLINDTLGHEAGDEVLRVLARRFRAFCGEVGCCARISGDEFVVVLPNHSRPEAVEAARGLLSQLAGPVTLQGAAVTVTASIGVSLFPKDGQDGDALLRHADTAMYQVKGSGKNGVRPYTPEVDEQVERRKLLERDIQTALGREELFLEYQGLYDLHSGELVKVEALLRWRHPQLGLVSPAEFIPVAESSGAIVPIGTWVLGAACAQVRQWQQRTGRAVRVTVNVAPLQLAQPDFVDTVMAALKSGGVSASQLELELTEGALLRDSRMVRQTLRTLQQLGLALAIDDFGTGYSSLSYLRDLPISSIKIDRSFVHDLSAPRRTPQYALALIEAILTVAQTLDLQVVAEGIETQAQLEVVRDLGCHVGQGFYWSRPLPPHELEKQLRRVDASGWAESGAEQETRRVN
ncbi:putative bifunctional diguanylate cyclase/phosphodiesterase [Deinococcus apachensis]|uniref:putative bifunctional diguanylate cyclase/phosphodiesterase n=1 Tax=Deinococcus apachensis TaxID=309886 RepID=UPI00035E24D6|nr:EAL domain-containing protein [Deinococcus apachensis]